MGTLTENQRKAAAMVEGLAHKFATGKRGEIVRAGNSVGLRYFEPTEVTWPRSEKVGAEAFVFSLAELFEFKKQLLNAPNEPHYAWILTNEGGRDEAAFARAGYHYLYTSAVYEADCDGARLRGAGACTIEEVTSTAQMDEINAAEPAWVSRPETLGDAKTIALCARDEAGAICAKGDVIFGTPEIGYIADMFTRPDRRKQGYGRAILSALHEAARQRGARQVTLLPSLMAYQTGFYMNCGYGSGCDVAALLTLPA